MDEDAREVRRGGELIDLTATEFELLRFLMRNPRRVLSKAQILDRVWNYDFGGQAHVVELYISYLRKKIDAGRDAAHPHRPRRRLRAEASQLMSGAAPGRPHPRAIERGWPAGRSRQADRRAAGAARARPAPRSAWSPTWPSRDSLSLAPSTSSCDSRERRPSASLQRVRPTRTRPGRSGGGPVPARRPAASSPPPAASNVVQPRAARRRSWALRIKDGEITNCGVVRSWQRHATCRRLTRGPAGICRSAEHAGAPPRSRPGRRSTTSANLTSLDERLPAHRGPRPDGDDPNHRPAADQRGRTPCGEVAIAELIVFRGVLLLAGVLGTGSGAVVAAAAAPGGRHRDPGDRAAAGLRRGDAAGRRARHRPAHRGRPGRRGVQPDARARRAGAGPPRGQRGAAAPVRRRRQPRAAHPAGRHPRLRRAGPAAPGPGARGRRPTR